VDDLRAHLKQVYASEYFVKVCASWHMCICISCQMCISWHMCITISCQMCISWHMYKLAYVYKLSYVQVVKCVVPRIMYGDVCHVYMYAYMQVFVCQ
jgi:hypothetical protein